MAMEQFLQKSGFKVLALARLTECEYSIVLYLMNCAVSGLEDIVTTEMELASLIHYQEEDVSRSLESLAGRQIVRARSSDHSHGSSAHPSIRLNFQFDMTRWQLDSDQDLEAHDAVVYPFSVGNRKAQLEILAKPPSAAAESREEKETWDRVVESFLQGRSFDDAEIETHETSARLLMQDHPVDQVLLLLRHFGLRIPSLSLLASNWSHFQELYEAETQQVDLMDARRKHQELDQRLKESSRKWLDSAEQFGLTASEISILKLLIRHRHPRRQLFWAWQARSRYLNLRDFFDENQSLMLAVTTAGMIVRKFHPTPGE